MTQEAQTVSIRLLEKEFSIACPSDQREELEASARYLDKKMAEIRKTGKLIGLERIAIMAAINITHELIAERNQQKRASSKRREAIEEDVHQLCLRIDSALSQRSAESDSAAEDDQQPAATGPQTETE